MAQKQIIQIGDVITRDNKDSYKVTIEIDEIKNNPFPNIAGSVVIEMPNENKDLVKKLETIVKTAITKYANSKK